MQLVDERRAHPSFLDRQAKPDAQQPASLDHDVQQLQVERVDALGEKQTAAEGSADGVVYDAAVGATHDAKHDGARPHHEPSGEAALLAFVAAELLAAAQGGLAVTLLPTTDHAALAPYATSRAAQGLVLAAGVGTARAGMRTACGALLCALQLAGDHALLGLGVGWPLVAGGAALALALHGALLLLRGTPDARMHPWTLRFADARVEEAYAREQFAQEWPLWCRSLPLLVPSLE